MRQQQSGHIFNTSSVAGLTADAFGSIYSATKFAVNAISYGTAAELKPFGIHVTNIIPGYFRTEFLNPNSYSVAHSSSPYAEMFTFVNQFLKEKNGNQAGDPHKAALLYLKVANMDNPPLDLPMGSDAYDAVVAVSNKKKQNLDAVKELTLSTDFDV
ncbi:SDR family NAD(P)-dependent oxidoreductase [Sporolactobacillus pectinivorans]|uniref:SDR family NAD(P)-dependent oxidoreductase n=1 Tax=Sporolactobacillus pectinivorans TaxID=1591408 RepID=UPI001961B5D2|nr:SDR family NAD(P)-dependent oxidoreductase [Sporolactobacillus pectinivorans]